MSDGVVELGFFACDERDGGAIFAQRLSRLEPETARTAGDERNASRQVEQTRKRRTHRSSEPEVAWDVADVRDATAMLTPVMASPLTVR